MSWLELQIWQQEDRRAGLQLHRRRHFCEMCYDLKQACRPQIAATEVREVMRSTTSSATTMKLPSGSRASWPSAGATPSLWTATNSW